MRIARSTDRHAVDSRNSAPTCDIDAWPVHGNGYANIAHGCAQDLRPVQICVPDVRAPEFVAAAHRQSATIATSMPLANLRKLLGRLADGDLVRLDRALLVFLGLAE